MKNIKKYLGDAHKAKKKWLKQRNNFKTEINASIFWDNEYSSGDAGGDKFNLSIEASEDVKKFVRWLEREYKGQKPINKNTKFVDAGCGNGRNAFYLAETFGAKGIGFDISTEAIRVANKKLSSLPKLNLSFFVQDLSQMIPVEDNTQDLVLDAVASHVLKLPERIFFKNEVLRVLTSGSYYFLKSLLLDQDMHAKRMIREDAGRAGEENSYIHPTMGIFEHIPTEEELIKFYETDFFIDKIERSFAHVVKGRANKRRYIVMYLRKK